MQIWMCTTYWLRIACRYVYCKGVVYSSLSSNLCTSLEALAGVSHWITGTRRPATSKTNNHTCNFIADEDLTVEMSCHPTFFILAVSVAQSITPRLCNCNCVYITTLEPLYLSIVDTIRTNLNYIILYFCTYVFIRGNWRDTGAYLCMLLEHTGKVLMAQDIHYQS